MATLTYDSTPADQPEFNEAEQEALAIGEQAEQEQQQMLAGKFTSPEQLEAAYLELQSKLGEPREEAPPEVVSPRDVAEPAGDDDAEPAVITQQQANILQESVGGKQAYLNMLDWASDNMAPEAIDMYNEVIEKGDPSACYFAVQQLHAYYNQVNGEGELLTGRGAPEQQDVFRSQAEVVAAMGDPRYDKDPAYRDDVFNKLSRSNIQY